MPTYRHLSGIALVLLCGVLSSCVPYATDPYYTQTSASQADPAYVNPEDIVGTWHDAWVWNGHKYRHTYTFYSDYTGSFQGETEWRDGGGMTNESSLQWAYDAHGGWNIRSYDSRITSGTGRIGEEAYEFKVRKVNDRIYYDKYKRTWVNANQRALVSQKEGNAGTSFENRQQLKQNLQMLQQTLQSFQ